MTRGGMILAAAVAAGSVWGADLYTIVGGTDSAMGYIQINEDLSSFGFNITSAGSNIDSNGQFGYYTFTSDDRADRVDGGLVTAGPGRVSLGDVAAGTKIGFYFAGGAAGSYYDYAFTPNGDGTYKVSFTESAAEQNGNGNNGNVNDNQNGNHKSDNRNNGKGNGKGQQNWYDKHGTWNGNGNGYGHGDGQSYEASDWVSIGGFVAEKAMPTTGMPLPGFLVALLVGSAGACGLSARRKRKE